MLSYIIIFWLVCGFISYGFSLAYWQRGWPSLAENNYIDDIIVSLIMSIIFGPIMLIFGIFIVKFYKHGFKLW